jgi:hypothetical protein
MLVHIGLGDGVLERGCLHGERLQGRIESCFDVFNWTTYPLGATGVGAETSISPR